MCVYAHVYLHGEQRSAYGSERGRYACLCVYVITNKLYVTTRAKKNI